MCKYMYFTCIIVRQGSLEVNPRTVIGLDFGIWTVLMQSSVIFFFCFRKLANSNLQLKQVPYNELFTIYQLHSVRTATTSGQYSSVWPSCSVNKKSKYMYFQITS